MDSWAHKTHPGHQPAPNQQLTPTSRPSRSKGGGSDGPGGLGQVRPTPQVDRPHLNRHNRQSPHNRHQEAIQDIDQQGRWILGSADPPLRSADLATTASATLLRLQVPPCLPSAINSWGTGRSKTHTWRRSRSATLISLGLV